MNSREEILGRLRQVKHPFPAVTPPPNYLPVVPVSDTSPTALEALFVAEAQKADCVLHSAESPAVAIDTILTLAGEDKVISSWELEQIPIPGLAGALNTAGITCVGQDADVRIGLTGVDAALAATGSIVLLSGAGRPRAASLLPPVHIAVMKTRQILPDLESWWAAQRAMGLEHVRKHSNIVVITGPSRTADIAMQLVMGMHGPRELHLILLHET